jgi:anti-sigma factor RsiW
MKITRDVVKDLLTVYLAGEASPDTRALVEKWLQGDAPLAREVEEARRGDVPPVPSPEPSLEKLALVRTRRRLRVRAIVLGVAIYFTTLPLTVTFNSNGFQGLLLKHWPERAFWLAVAAAVWTAYFVLSRRLRRSGL